MINVILKRFTSIKVGTAEHDNVPITKEYSDALKETLPGLPPRREVEHKIEIIGTIPKPTAIYKLSPFEDQTLKEHLFEALKKNLICISKSHLVQQFSLFRKWMVTASSNRLSSAQCRNREKPIPTSTDQ